MGRAGVLVDVDGTLVDSNYHHTLAWSRALRDHGEDARLAAIHRLVGMGSSELLQELIGRDDDEIARSWRGHFDRLLPEVRALPGAGELLRALHQRGLVVVLATSSPADLLDELRDRLDADDAVDVVITAGDVDHAKPQPDIFAVSLQRADLQPEDAMVVGDSVWDVEAATRAQLLTVGVETGGFSRFELEHAGAIAVFQDPADLVRNLDDSPFTRLFDLART